MGLGGGVCLKLSQTTVRAIALLADIVILAIFSYFLAILSDHKLNILREWKGVEGIAGAGVLYGAFGVLLTLCLGGLPFFAFIAIALDVCFVGAHVAIAYLTRHGGGKCSGNVTTPLGTGPSNSKAPGYGSNGFGFGGGDHVTYYPNLFQACRLQKAVLACAVINIGLFLIAAVLQFFLAKHHQSEKRFHRPAEAGFSNGTTSRGRFWRRKNKRNTRDAELATSGHHEKYSHDTTTTNGQGGYGYAHPATTATNY